MSRCFPFPPPGYEGKIKAEDPGLLKKEKEKEKKHKKDKKDKEKKENKEKHNKERTDEKRREKKDKKEKHREKKDKDKDVDKNKHKVNGLFPDERVVGRPEVHLPKLPEKRKVRENDGNGTLYGKRVAGPSVSNEEPLSKNNHLASQIASYAPGLGRRNTDEEIGSQLPDRNHSSERKKDALVKIAGADAVSVVDGKEKPQGKPAASEKMDVRGVIGDTKFTSNALGQNVVGTVKLPGKTAGPLVDGRKRKEKQAIDGRIDEQAVAGVARSTGSALPGNIVGMGQNRVPTVAKSVEKKLEHKLEEKEKLRDRKVGYKNGGKRKDEDREKPIHKDKEKEKEKKKKVKISEQKHVPMAIKRDGSENHLLTPSAKNENKDLSGFLSAGLHSMPSSQGGATLLRKRKDMGLNGIYDEHITGPNELAKTTVSTHPLIENGRSLEPCQNSDSFAADMQRPPMNIKVERTFAPDDTQRPPMNMKVDGKECKVDDIATGPFTESSQTIVKAERKSKVSAKPAHPDAKYLSQVLSVPKLDDWPEFDDQEWLLSCESFQTKKPQVEASGVEEKQNVWASALWLESVDVFALPYVIPH